jgi:hypothetical protein
MLLYNRLREKNVFSKSQALQFVKSGCLNARFQPKTRLTSTKLIADSLGQKKTDTWGSFAVAAKWKTE